MNEAILNLLNSNPHTAYSAWQIALFLEGTTRNVGRVANALRTMSGKNGQLRFLGQGHEEHSAMYRARTP